jgi:hypothetical protein
LLLLEDQVAARPVDLLDHGADALANLDEPAELPAGDGHLSLGGLEDDGGAELAVDGGLLELDAAVVGADDERLGPDVDVEAAVVLRDGADVHELGELAEDGVALVAQAVGDAGAAALGDDDLAVEVRDLLGKPVGVGRLRFEARVDVGAEAAELAAEVVEPVGDGVAVLEDDLAQAGVLRLVGEVGPAVEKRAEARGEVVLAQLVERGLDAAEPLLGRWRPTRRR